MKTLHALLLAALLAGCGATGASDHDPTVETGEPFELGPGHVATVEDVDVSVRFVAVREDSRCPRDVTCVWAGNAVIALQVARVPGGSPADVIANSTTPPRTVEAAGVRIEVLELFPTPRSEHTIRPGDYRVRLVVEAAGG